MSNFEEEQEEELEVLRSIYEGDEKFNEINTKCFQYKYGTEDNKSILVEISWPETYPSVLPNVSLDLFHNKYLPPDFKNEVRDQILEQGQDFLDCAMTYSLFDWMNENADDFINRIPEMEKRQQVEKPERDESDQPVKVEKQRKEQLTKAQKRRITERTNHKGERERGWNWVDVIRHLSQTGGGA